MCFLRLNFVADPCEPPCQNIPGPNVGSAPGGASAAAPGSNTSTNALNANAPSTSGANNPVIPTTSTSLNTSVSSSPTATSTNHQSPYDLRKKSPSSNHDLWTSGPSTSQAYQYQTSALCSGGASSSSSSHGTSNVNNDAGGCYLLPARKRPRRIYSSGADTTITSAAHYLQYEMPDEVLLTIFSYLLEQDLCRLALVCKRFNTIANDTELWKRLYQNVYEYDMPLFNPESCKFHFLKPEDSEYANPWKESFRQLYRGIHVRPGYQDRRYKGRNIVYFNTVQAALDYADERASAANACSNNSSSSNSVNCSAAINSSCIATDDAVEMPGSLIFLHAGHYRGEFLVIDSDVALIGAAPGNVAESIVLERESESTVMFVEGAKHAYVGHMTLKFSPDVTSTVPHHKHYCLEVGENCSPTVDHCIIRSTSVVGAAVCVSGVGANPVIRHCDISDCENVGLYVTDYAQGTYEHNEISRNALAGIWVKNFASPIMRENHIHHGRDVGIFTFDNGMVRARSFIEIVGR